MWGSGVSDGGKSVHRGPVAERSPDSMGKMGRKMAAEGGREAEGWTQGVVCISGSDLVIGHKERDVTAGEAERAPW